MRIKDARQTFVGIWIRRLLEDDPIEVWGGEQLRDFNDVEDVVDALLTAAWNESSYGQVFNLGSAQRISLRELAELMISLRGAGDLVIKEYPADRRKIDIGVLDLFQIRDGVLVEHWALLDNLGMMKQLGAIQ
jgi:UDP-glucose 4-epimerase